MDELHANKEEEVPMTVDTYVPNGDTVEEVQPSLRNLANVLVISEEGGMMEMMSRVQYNLNIRYFQRLPGGVTYIASDNDVIQHVESWRPHIIWADMIVVDDPSYVARLGKDFNLDGKLVLYRIDSEAHGEAERLLHWMNPLTLATLRDAMESVDIEPAVGDIFQAPPRWNIGVLNWLRRLFRRRRG